MTHQDYSAEQHFTTMMRYFCSRVVQTVVQSRMGKDYKVSQPCNLQNDNLVWFNIVIDEIGEIAAHLKQKMDKFSLSLPFCLEFTLHTADGGYLPMELWVIRLDKNFTDENADIRSVVYSQLTTLLKSVIMAARFTPIYRHYSSIQRLDTFVILYKVKICQPDLSLLGEECKFRQLGNLPTPFGSVRLDLYYRTKIVLLPPPLTENSKCEKNLSRKLSTNVYGNVVPEKNSTIIMSSPALEDVNCFSTSPLSQDFPFVDVAENKDEKLSSNLDPSFLTPETTNIDGLQNIFHENIESNATISPKAPSSFPLQNRQLKIRNNSFPFASLLMMDLNASDDSFRSQILPKVPEDVPISSGLQASTSDRGLSNVLNNKLCISSKKKCSLSFDSKILDKNSEEKQLCILNKQKKEDFCEEKNDNIEKKIFDSNIESDSINKNLPEKNHEILSKELDEKNKTYQELKNDDESEFQSFSSDDSYVKVVAFASTDNLYSNLTDFAQEMHLAPKDLASCLTESANDLTKQIDEFRDRAVFFDDFVASLREMDEHQ